VKLSNVSVGTKKTEKIVEQYFAIEFAVHVVLERLFQVRKEKASYHINYNYIILFNKKKL
jgi:hypothetical protein